jgi:hypothetical protein
MNLSRCLSIRLCILPELFRLNEIYQITLLSISICSSFIILIRMFTTSICCLCLCVSYSFAFLYDIFHIKRKYAISSPRRSSAYYTISWLSLCISTCLSICRCIPQIS